MTTHSLPNDILFARQPIMDSTKGLFGFEILYRGIDYDLTKEGDGHGATAELLNNLCSCLKEHKTLHNIRLFINVDEHFINSPSFFPNPSTEIVLEILETVKPTPSVLGKLASLRKDGFQFALDDFEFEPERMAFIPYVDFIKIDVLLCNKKDIQAQIEALKGRGVTFIAEKIETQEAFEEYKELGVSYFQGYFLERPTLTEGVKLSANKQVVLKLLSELSRDDIEVEEAAEITICDPNLMVKLLLLVNSLLLSIRCRVIYQW
ncbi:MAG: EAL domain-containing protein [Gammaproteobacteria bacterium]|nr:EAL domain-containing protein [Gammaproteobacteria bacterium]